MFRVNTVAEEKDANQIGRKITGIIKLAKTDNDLITVLQQNKDQLTSINLSAALHKLFQLTQMRDMHPHVVKYILSLFIHHKQKFQHDRDLIADLVHSIGRTKLESTFYLKELLGLVEFSFNKEQFEIQQGEIDNLNLEKYQKQKEQAIKSLNEHQSFFVSSKTENFDFEQNFFKRQEVIVDQDSQQFNKAQNQNQQINEQKLQQFQTLTPQKVPLKSFKLQQQPEKLYQYQQQQQYQLYGYLTPEQITTQEEKQQIVLQNDQNQQNIKNSWTFSQLSRIVQGLAMMKYHDYEFLQQISYEMSNLLKFEKNNVKIEQSVCQGLYGLAQLNIQHVQLIKSVGEYIQQILKQNEENQISTHFVHPQNVAMLITAYSIFKLVDPVILNALCQKQIIPNINQYNLKCIVKILGGFSSLGYRDDEILKLVRDRIVDGEFEFEMSHYFEIIRFFVRFQGIDQEVYEKMTEAVGKSVKNLTLDELADVVNQFSRMDPFYNEQFYSQISARIIDLIQKMEQLSSYNLNSHSAQLILSSFAHVRHFDDNLFRCVCQHLKSNWQKSDLGRYPNISSQILFSMAQQQFIDVELILNLSQILLKLESNRKIWLAIWSMALLGQFENYEWWIKMGQRRHKFLLGEEEARALIKVKYICQSAKRMDIYEALNITKQEEKQAMTKLKSNKNSIKKTISQVQAEILDVFEDCGVVCKMEKEIFGGGISIDFVFQYGGYKYAVEVDGPHHFSRNQPYKKTGRTITRNFILRGGGWKVIEVPVHEWELLQGVQEKQEFVIKLLGKHVYDFQSASTF